MVSTHCHFSQKAAYGHARASSYCIYSFFNVARDSIPVARYAICVSREGGNLHLGGTVCLTVDCEQQSTVPGEVDETAEHTVLVKVKLPKAPMG